MYLPTALHIGHTAHSALNLFPRASRPRTGRDSAVGSPSRGDLSPVRNNPEVDDVLGMSQSDIDLSIALEDNLLQDEYHQNSLNAPRRSRFPPAAPMSRLETSTPRVTQDNNDRLHHAMNAYPKRATDKYECEDDFDLLYTLRKLGAQTAIVYHSVDPDPEANDIWPNFRNKAKLPARYSILDLSQQTAASGTSNAPSQSANQSRYELRSHRCPSGTRPLEAKASPTLPPFDKGRPFWHLPVELVEHITKYLNRDDVKSLRLVSRELNEFTSQAAFKTVVVPFNTEIYGMLGQEPTIDRKGKKRAKISRPEYSWKNANGDELYNGHGLDVFRGFGRHIVKYGMSFVVSEDSLLTPPRKAVTEQKTSFWGNYDWPYEEYRRFDAVAGLESAADETPRMKIAFSELTKVKELALSVDSGLGWLNGPDRSIRARILQKPPSIFGHTPSLPDRRSQAQSELWNYIENAHALAGEDIRLASLYVIDGARPVAESRDLRLLSAVRSNLPFVDTRVLHEAKQVDSTDCYPSQSTEETEEGSRVVSTNAGVLFTSAQQHCEEQLGSGSIKPSNLSLAQKEWLLETDWAQRAFMSSYMLSIIDNQGTFRSIHTLNISGLSDRYISMLNRTDFWDALPNLRCVTLIIIPGWRTVEKDEASYVETPKVDPTGHVDTFCELLRAQIAPRTNIFRLTIGYSASGEHAEGLHARNKLLMPAPVLPLKVRLHSDNTLPLIDTVTLQDAMLLQQALVHFTHLKELTLRNCWITPSALLQFVKLHDTCALQHLTLDSVSLTAVLRLPGDAQPANAGQQLAVAQNAAAAIQIGAFWNHAANNIALPAAAGSPWNSNAQVLSTYVQTLIGQVQQIQANAGNNQPAHPVQALYAQLQQQLQNAQALAAQQPQGNLLHAVNPVQQNLPGQPQQQYLAQMMHLNQLATQLYALQQTTGHNVPVHNAAHPVAPTTNATDSNSSILHGQPREGSWMDIIDRISPGNNLSDFDSPHSKADPNRKSALKSISFISCGYAKLSHLGLGIDQVDVDHGHTLAGVLRNAVFMKRYNALSAVMLSSKWQYLGEIVQEVHPSEIVVLDAAWNLRHGWDDAEAARAVEFDGLLSGGTGRFTGKVQRSDRVHVAADPAS